MISEDYTIKDVAFRAQLSPATVSRILSGKRGHNPGTVQRVRAIADKLQAEAQSKEFGRPEDVGVLLFSYHDFLNSNYNATLMTSIMETLTAENCTAQLVVLTASRLNPAYVKQLVARHSLKGLIVLEFNMLYELSDRLPELGLPIVKIGNLDGPGTGGAVIHADNRAAGADAASYLWSQGHRRFGMVCMDRRDVCQDMRIRGFCERVEQLGGDGDGVWTREYQYQSESLAPAAAELANMGSGRPTAIVSTNSLLSRKLLLELHQAGLPVPEALSLVSFEEDRELEYMIPPVTVLAQPTRLMGEMAARQIAQAIHGRTPVSTEMLRCSLVVRQSVKPLSPSP